MQIRLTKFKNFKCTLRKIHTYVYPFKSPKGLNFEIKPITYQNLEENAREITKCFKNEPLASLLDSEYLLTVFRKITEKSVREELGIACYEQTTGKWAGTIISDDYSTSTTDPSAVYDGKYDYCLDIPGYIEREGMKKLGIKQSTNRNEQIHIILVGVHQDFWGQKVLYHLFDFYNNHHPIVKNAKLVLLECTNSCSTKPSEKAGLKTVLSIKYSELAQVEQLKNHMKDYKQMLKNTNKSEDEMFSFNCLNRY
jgi:hypothetical protein